MVLPIESANGLELWVESSLLPSEESYPQGILEVAGRPSPAIYNFQTWLLNIKVITWQGLLSSEFCSWHPASCPKEDEFKTDNLHWRLKNSSSLPSQ